jgi:hypothetical protein
MSKVSGYAKTKKTFHAILQRQNDPWPGTFSRSPSQSEWVRPLKTQINPTLVGQAGNYRRRRQPSMLIYSFVPRVTHPKIPSQALAKR